MVLKREEGQGSRGLMTLIDRRSFPFVGAGVKCGQKNERREVELIMVIDDLPQTTLLKRSVALWFP